MQAGNMYHMAQLQRMSAKAGDAGLIPGSGRSPRGGKGDPLSSIFIWEIPWTEEPDGLQSMGLQGVRHDQACMPILYALVG